MTPPATHFEYATLSQLRVMKSSTLFLGHVVLIAVAIRKY